MFGTPLHPLLVHFPIALLIVGTAFQIIAVWKKDFFDKAALLLLSLGFLSGIIAYLSGDGAEQFAASQWGNGYRSIVHIHQAYATVTLLLFGAAIGLRLINYFFKRKFIMPLVLIICLTGSITLALTGHYGGEMVYIQKHASSLNTLKID
ncbi:hypothetical protein E4665_01345 [Sporolactobacillus shoreae]|uniref:DUF2231 domain-containing protein n=1 Tax=Sporolactobacillus shoreae TaxID=1465501 RepID=A0A4Z0GTN9_9BACL|nr:DUF2231 domain-containing protein [Sporolactobacillus shoreae]TGB00350.1 hypothetical protein E4665_01345 [Sporolactobacillus shoreae]